MGRRNRSNRFSGLGNRRHQETKVGVNKTQISLGEFVRMSNDGKILQLSSQDHGYVWSNPWDENTPMGSIPLSCNLCGDEIGDRIGHNPFPLIETGKERCCETCNTEQVIPSRLGRLGGDQ